VTATPRQAEPLPGDIDSINHAGVAVRDLDRASAEFERLGFTLTPLSLHSGALEPGAPVRPYGSGNRCAVFRRSYLEVLAHVRTDLPDFFVRGFLARFEGAHIVCFGCADIQAPARRLDQNAVRNSGVIPLRRDVETLRAGEPRTETARFHVLHFERGGTPEGLIQATQHLDPHLIHQPRYRAHANGALDLAEVALAVRPGDVAATAQRYQRYLGRPPAWSDDIATFTLPLGRLVIMPERQARLRYGQPPPALPALVALGVAVADLDATARLLANHAVTVRETDTGLLTSAAGTTILFEPERGA
jgi:hypothetical protein